MSDAIQERARVQRRARQERKRRYASESFSNYVETLNPSLLDFEHVPRLVDAAERVVQGEIDRLMVLLPPRYFKSEVFSRLLPSYFLHTNPQGKVGLASYSAKLAWKLSGNARGYYQELGGETARDTDAKKEWANTFGGQMWAAGVDGSITGSGFDLGIIDDPMKPKHVRSRAYIEAFRAFYPETWYNRQEPDAAMIVVMQRLGDEDPVDFLYRREVGDGVEEAPEHWHVLCCDEIKSDEKLSRYDGPQGLPETCTLMDDPRETGEILAPSRFDEEAVGRQQQAAGPYGPAQRQQRPEKPQGDFWREGWFQVFGEPNNNPIDDLPEDAHDGGRDWDTAYTKKEQNSASAQVQSFRDTAEEPNVYITDADWKWLETPELVFWMGGKPPENEIPPFPQVSPPHYVEAKASGKSSAQFLQRENIPVEEVEVDGGDKFARASGVQPIASAGRVHVHASIAHKLLHGERQGLLRVTAEKLMDGGPDLDLNDAFVQAINRHTTKDGQSGKTADIPL